MLPNLSCPAMSHICSLTTVSSSQDRTFRAKSTPMVALRKKKKRFIYPLGVVGRKPSWKLFFAAWAFDLIEDSCWSPLLQLSYCPRALILFLKMLCSSGKPVLIDCTNLLTERVHLSFFGIPPTCSVPRRTGARISWWRRSSRSPARQSPGSWRGTPSWAGARNCWPCCWSCPRRLPGLVTVRPPFCFTSALEKWGEIIMR